MAKLYSAFPGVGKTYYFNHTDRTVLDSDSSLFNKEHFPQNYIEHIKKHLGSTEIILISSHKEVRDALVENGLKFTLIYPHKSRKDEYLKRYEERGSPHGFIDLLAENWEEWLTQLEEQKNCSHVVLGPGQFLSDVID